VPGIVAGNLGNAWLILPMWIFVGLWSLLGANIYAEIGTMLPEAGGPYVYLPRAYGNLAGFAGGLNDFCINIFGVAYVAINVGEFSSALFPAFSGKENLIAAVIILALVF
jgi:APA family basic amino acid/polyamine antiporter